MRLRVMIVSVLNSLFNIDLGTVLNSIPAIRTL